MKTIVISTVSTRNAIFHEDDYQIGSLIYPNWYSSKAVITIADGSTFLLKPKGGFSTGVLVKESDVAIFSTVSNWKAQVVISDIIHKRDYILKLKGIFSNSYILTDSQGRELFSIRQLFSWKQFRTSYEIQFTNFDLFHKEHEILMFTTFYSYKNLVAAVAIGTN